jgi:mRNA interferase HigB
LYALGMARAIRPSPSWQGDGSAGKVEEYVVINVGGNKYRLIAIVSYPTGRVYIQDVLTHKEYDRGTWKGD